MRYVLAGNSRQMATLTPFDMLLGYVQLVLCANLSDYYQHGEVCPVAAALSVSLLFIILFHRRERIPGPGPHGNGTRVRRHGDGRRARTNLHDNCSCLEYRTVQM